MIAATQTKNPALQADCSLGCIRQLLAVAVLAAGFMASPVKADETVSLAGEWRFQLDRADAGEGERWFARDLSERIQLPGALQNQGFGDDITVDTKWTGGSGVEQWMLPKYEKYRQPGNIKIPFFLQPEKHYVGTAWYQRDIEIPADWQDRRVVLTLERAHWQTQAWLDEQPLGTNNSLFTPHVYDLGTGVAPGRHRLSIRVDNRLIVNVGARAHGVSDETQGNWNGVVGELKLTTTSPVWIEDAQAYPDITRKTALVKVRIGNVTGNAGSGILKIGEVRRPISWSEKGGEAEVELSFGSAAKLWDEFTPALQKVTVKLTGDHADDERQLVFGLREIGTKDRQFIINGRPVFFRGTLECCIFPLTGYPPTDVDSWKRIIRICQSHGLNHIRFHSWCPPEAAFVAADEMGFYYQVEYAWIGRISENLGAGLPADQWLYDEAVRVLKSYGNHPSFLLMPYGNEPHGKENYVRWLVDWVNHWKQTDPRRLYTSAAAWPAIPENQYHIIFQTRGTKGWLGRDYSEALINGPWVPPFYKEATIQQADVPVIVHEMGMRCAYPDFAAIPKYAGPLKPKNFEIVRDSLAEHGMLHQAKDFFMASGKLQALCYKEDIEAALRTPGIGGVQLLDLHDFPGQGTALVGVLDPFWDSKPYITPAEFRRFYNSTVPLARMTRHTWTTAETLTADVEIAHFGAAPLNNAQPYWKVLTGDGHVAASGELPAQTVPLGQGTKLGQFNLALGKLPAPKQYKLVVGLKGTKFENDWNFWVYPAALPVTRADVLVTEFFDEAARQRLADGGKVLLASGRLGTGNLKLFYEPILWNHFMCHDDPRQTLGLLCDPKHPALAQFPTEYFQDWQWYEIVTSASAIVLDHLPQGLLPIVQPIDDWNTNRKLGLIFECLVGKGKLLVCAADLAKDLEHRSAARQLRASLLAYAESKMFDPKVTVTEAAATELLDRARPSALVKLGAKVIACDSQAAAFPVANVIDGNPDTFWHTRYGNDEDPMPHSLVIDLGRETRLSGISYLPRQNTSSGRCLDCDVYASNDPASWGESAATVKWQDSDQWQTLLFAKPARARYLKLAVKSEVKNRFYASVAELDIVTAIAGASALGSNLCAAETERPNILWLTSEDLGPEALSRSGTPQASTPNLDKLASQGVYFSHTYLGTVCSPSRSAFMTGMYAVTIDAQNQRSHRDGKHPLPDGVRLLTDWIRDAGYFAVNVAKMPDDPIFKTASKKGFTYSQKTLDLNFTYTGKPYAKPFDSTDWGDLKLHQPFYAVLNFEETHRVYNAPAKADPAKVVIPPYYPDHPVARKDWAAYLDSASELDRKIGIVLAQLEKDGLADNTIVMFFGDNGASMARGKEFCYEEGAIVPMMIRWPKNFPLPENFKPGSVDPRFIDGIDFAPTMLDIAGAPKPPKMQGRIFLGAHAEPAPEYIFTTRDRVDETVMRIRSVRDARYRYIHNFTPETPFLAPNKHLETVYPVWNLIKQLHAEGKLTPAQEFLCQPRLPDEELYDLQADPHEISNLAASTDAEHQGALKRLRGVLDQWIVDWMTKAGCLNPPTNFLAAVPRKRRRKRRKPNEN